MRTVLVVAAAACLFPVSAVAARISPASVSASSSYPPEDGVRYEPTMGVDGKLATAWVEGVDGGGLGEWLEVSLGGKRKVQGMRIWAGMWYSYQFWSSANRPREIEVRFSDGSSERFTLRDEMTVQKIDFAKEHMTDSVQIRIKSIYSGTAWTDTGISEVQVFDAAPEDFVPVSGYASSSQLPDDTDGNYNPENVGDGLNDSMWCEGNTGSDGTGEWIELKFPGRQSVSKLSLVNGIGSTMAVWFKGNRATSATLSFSDGSSQQIEIKDTFRSQEIQFSPVNTSKIRITVTGVKAGKEYNDLCLSELYAK